MVLILCWILFFAEKKNFTMAEERNSTTVSQDKADNVDVIFDYVVNNKYAAGMSKNDKANLRRLSKHYVE